MFVLFGREIGTTDLLPSPNKIHHLNQQMSLVCATFHSQKLKHSSCLCRCDSLRFRFIHHVSELVPLVINIKSIHTQPLNSERGENHFWKKKKLEEINPNANIVLCGASAEESKNQAPTIQLWTIFCIICRISMVAVHYGISLKVKSFVIWHEIQMCDD